MASVGCEEFGKVVVQSVAEGVSEGIEVNPVSFSDNDLDVLVQHANDACPIRIDSSTTFDRVERSSDHSMQFIYTVSRQLSNDQVQELKSVAVQQMAGNGLVVPVVRQNLTISHVFQDESGSELERIEFDKSNVLKFMMEAQSDQIAKMSQTIAEQSNRRDSKFPFPSAPQSLRGFPNFPNASASDSDSAFDSTSTGSRESSEPAKVKANPFFKKN